MGIRQRLRGRWRILRLCEFELTLLDLLAHLRWRLESAGFAVQEFGIDVIVVEVPDATAQARREIGLHLRLWGAMHPEARVTRSAA
jgi:hypothetical protein